MSKNNKFPLNQSHNLPWMYHKKCHNILISISLTLYKIILSFWLWYRSLCGRIIEFLTNSSLGTCTLLPIIVIEGLSLPLVKSDWWSHLAYALFGSGSEGVPSIRTQEPIVLFQPIILYKMQEWFWTTVLPRMIDSRIRTPGPMVTPKPTDTFGPSCLNQKT